MRFLSREGWNEKSKLASVLMVDSPCHDECGLDPPVLSQGKFLGQQSVDGLQRAHLAAFELSHSRVEDFDGTWHLEADQGALDAVDHGGNDLRMARH